MAGVGRLTRETAMLHTVFAPRPIVNALQTVWSPSTTPFAPVAAALSEGGGDARQEEELLLVAGADPEALELLGEAHVGVQSA